MQCFTHNIKHCKKLFEEVLSLFVVVLLPFLNVVLNLLKAAHLFLLSKYLNYFISSGKLTMNILKTGWKKGFS